MKLYEMKHKYYCGEGCYFSNECHEKFKSWDDFLAEWGESDEDYNLLYRWDWENYDLADADEGAEATDRLLMYFMLQRKARPMSVYVNVHKDQEPEIREWLKRRGRTIVSFWGLEEAGL